MGYNLFLGESMKHKHHIVPKHAGGTDDPTNIIELTVEEHAEAHRILYEKYGRKGDFWAWQGLSGRIGKDEIMRQILSENGKKSCSPGGYIAEVGRYKGGQTNKASGHMSNLGKQITSDKTHQAKAGRAGGKVSGYLYGPANARKTNSLRYTCSCGKQMSPGNLGRHIKANKGHTKIS